MEQAEPIEIRKSRNFGEQINVTFAFLRENFKSLGKAILFIVGPTALVAGALIGYFFIDVLALTRVDRAGHLMESGLSLIVGGIFAFASTILLWGVVVDYVRLYLDRNGATFGTSELWAEVKGDLGRITLTALGLGLIFGGGYMVLVAIVVVRSVFLIALFFLVAVAAACYVYVPISLIFTVRLCEEDGFWASISRCFELVKGYWWKTFGILFVLNMIVNTVSSIFLFPAQIFISFGSFSGMETGGVMKLIITILLMIGMVLAYLLAAVPALGATLQYFNLVEKHEGVGLMGRIEAIGDGDQSNLNTNTY